MDNLLLFTDRHAPSVRVVMGPSLHSLRHHLQEFEEHLENSSEVYDSQNTVSLWSESRSEFDPVDSDLWTEVWGPDYESDDSEIKNDMEPIEREAGSNLSLQQQHRAFGENRIKNYFSCNGAFFCTQTSSSPRLNLNLIEVCQQIPRIANNVDEEVPELIYDSDDNDSDNDNFPIYDSDSVDYVGSDSDDENDPSMFHTAASNLEPVEEVLEPWSSLLPIAEEDELTELPCSFLDFLAFTELGYEAAVQVYLGLLESHVCEEFQKNSNIMHLLKTKGVKVFVPQNWKGVRFKPLHIDFIEGMPSLMKPRARPVNPKLFDHAHKEFLRLLTYMYVRCDGPIACPLVIAPKATAPFIRFCGDYTLINKFIPHWHTPMKNPQQTFADELVHHDAFGDADMSNAYHQLPIDEETSFKLSIQTSWKQVRPLFLPEGIPIGNAHLPQNSVLGTYRRVFFFGIRDIVLDI